MSDKKPWTFSMYTIFVGLPLGDKILILEGFSLLILARLSLIIFPFKKIAGFLGSHMHESKEELSSKTELTLTKIRWVLKRVSPYVFTRALCMEQAIVAKIMLRSRGLKNTLYLGVEKDESNKKLNAHAWVKCAGQFVTGKKGSENFTVVSTFGD